MPKKIYSADRLAGLNLNGGSDTSYSYDQIKAALLFNIRDQIEASNGEARAARRVLERIDRRLAAHFPITKAGKKYKRPPR